MPALANVANNYQYFGDYEKTLEYQFEALPIVEEMGDPIYLSSVLNNISGTYQLMQQYNKALPYAERSLKITQEQEDYFGEASALLSLGIIYNKAGQHENALDYFNKALNVSQKQEITQIEILALSNISEQYRQHAEPAKGLPYALRGIPMAEELGENETLAQLLHSAGAAYYDMSRYKEAQPLLKRAININRQFQFRDQLKEVYLVASDAELVLGNYDTAAYYRKEFRLLSDSLLNEMVLQNTVELETKYKTAQKQAEIERLQTQSENQQLRLRQRQGVIIGMGTFIGLLATLGFLYYQNFQGKQQIARQEIEIGQQKFFNSNRKSNYQPWMPCCAVRKRSADDLHATCTMAWAVCSPVYVKPLMR
ncbi:MAG: tetratricopeptide repeat protein [Saprospiraceae bacterium]|nr:tetratricopeptide repeat protein [Saprospiraceae bacterium]